MDEVVTTASVGCANCKAPVKLSPPTTNTQLSTGRMPFLLHNQQCHITQGKTLLAIHLIQFFGSPSIQELICA